MGTGITLDSLKVTCRTRKMHREEKVEVGEKEDPVRTFCYDSFSNGTIKRKLLLIISF